VGTIASIPAGAYYTRPWYFKAQIAMLRRTKENFMGLYSEQYRYAKANTFKDVVVGYGTSDCFH
jgi:hypothetical protein